MGIGNYLVGRYDPMVPIRHKEEDMTRFEEKFGYAMYKPCKATLMALAREAVREDRPLAYEFGLWSIESHAYDPDGSYLEVVSPHWERYRVYYPRNSFMCCGD